MNLGNFFAELKRRNVYKVAIAYAVVAWLLVQVATQVYAGLGNKDKAFEWLEKAYQERADSLAWFRFDPESKRLRTDPCFAALMRKVGFTEP